MIIVLLWARTSCIDQPLASEASIFNEQIHSCISFKQPFLEIPFIESQHKIFFRVNDSAITMKGLQSTNVGAINQSQSVPKHHFCLVDCDSFHSNRILQSLSTSSLLLMISSRERTEFELLALPFINSADNARARQMLRNAILICPSHKEDGTYRRSQYADFPASPEVKQK